jgi:hypothetical protein
MISSSDSKSHYSLPLEKVILFLARFGLLKRRGHFIQKSLGLLRG